MAKNAIKMTKKKEKTIFLSVLDHFVWRIGHA